MPTVTYQLQQITTAHEGPFYRVYQEILEATNSEKEVYVYRTSNDEFSHIATIHDMNAWPPTKEEAVEDDLEFYRQVSVERDWLTIPLMVEDVNLGVSRVQLLASDLTDVDGLLEIDRTLTLTGV